MPLPRSASPISSSIRSLDSDLAQVKATVPDPLAKALVTWRALATAPKPARPDGKALIAAVGSLMAATAAKLDGKLNGDTALITDVRLDQLIAAHRRAEVRAEAFQAAQQAAAAEVVRALARVEPELLESLQSRYAVLAKTMVTTARALPPDFGEVHAAYAAPELNTLWYQALQAHKEQQAIRGLVAALDLQRSMDHGVRDVQFVKTTLVRENTDRFGECMFGDLTSLAGALALARAVGSPGELWVPLWREAADQASRNWPAQRGASVAASR